MIISKRFMKFMDDSKDDSDTQGSVYNWSILTFSQLNFKDRLWTAIEILLGFKFVKFMSSDQKAENPNKCLSPDFIFMKLGKKK